MSNAATVQNFSADLPLSTRPPCCVALLGCEGVEAPAVVVLASQAPGLCGSVWM